MLRDRFIDTFGFWNEMWNSLLVADPEFFEAYLHYGGVPWQRGHLDPKTKELIHVAVDGAATHLFVPGLRDHIRQALRLGATKEELMEVLELTSTLGIHACNIGVPILVEELIANGEQIDFRRSERQERLKQEFENKRGYWNKFWDALLVLDEDFFESYIHFSSVPWVSGVLEPKIKELIYTAFDVAATHLYESGLRQHIRNAIGYGATKEEIMEVIALASTLGIHSCNVGVPILLEELQATASVQQRANGADE
ncbi:carboxymuconolactone decarboxylase family protein [Alicyclobacillus kakegawensis]|uniref:carboxymuconolactone decarboxylase family protein n=1 Tax=Alicyclobacillus kakegawensis TaxID=392012 RepID=UPI000A668435|nr:carboxymuconolactone decarboxylase family protein [Alicyclobacillus kakegawensis]